MSATRASSAKIRPSSRCASVAARAAGTSSSVSIVVVDDEHVGDHPPLGRQPGGIASPLGAGRRWSAGRSARSGDRRRSRAGLPCSWRWRNAKACRAAVYARFTGSCSRVPRVPEFTDSRGPGSRYSGGLCAALHSTVRAPCSSVLAWAPASPARSRRRAPASFRVFLKGSAIGGEEVDRATDTGRDHHHQQWPAGGAARPGDPSVRRCATTRTGGRSS